MSRPLHLSRAVPALLLLAGSCGSLPTGGGASGGDEEAWRFVLTDVTSGTHLEEFVLRAADLGLSGSWSVERRTLRGGKQEGVDQIVIQTAALRAVVLPTRGMSVFEVLCDGVRIGWDSPLKEIVHPALINLESRGGLGWLEGFNEWMVRCGLEFAGHPGKDEFTDNTGAEATLDLTLHGKIGNTPAARVEVLVDRQPPHRIRVRGTVYERFFYGPGLELRSEFSVVPGEPAWRISDRVANLGAGEQEFQLIYHGNYGPPLLEEGSQLTVAARSVRPMNQHAAGSIEGYRSYAGPTPGFIEQVYLIEPFADSSGRCRVLLQNRAGDLGLSVSWEQVQLPYFTQWKNTAASAAGYVTGLEPGTGFPFNRAFEREHGRVPRLSPGEAREFDLEFQLHTGTDAVRSFAHRVQAAQAQGPTELLELY